MAHFGVPSSPEGRLAARRKASQWVRGYADELEHILTVLHEAEVEVTPDEKRVLRTIMIVLGNRCLEGDPDAVEVRVDPGESRW